eukprot:EG_transcript_2805
MHSSFNSDSSVSDSAASTNSSRSHHAPTASPVRDHGSRYRQESHDAAAADLPNASFLSNLLPQATKVPMLPQPLSPPRQATWVVVPPLMGVETADPFDAWRLPLWSHVRPVLPAFLIPLLIIVFLAAGNIAAAGQPVAPWFPLLYSVVCLLTLVATFAFWLWRSISLLQEIATRLKAVLESDPERSEIPTLSLDPRVRFLQSLVLVKGRPEPEAKEDALAALRADNPGWVTSPDGYVLVDSGGAILWCNDALCDFLGYDAEELVGENVRILMPQPYRDRHDHFLRRYLARGRPRIMGTTRDVPLVNKRAKESIVWMSLDEWVDPDDPNHRLFIGRFSFQPEDPVLASVREKFLVSVEGFSEVLPFLNDVEEALIVTTLDSTVKYINNTGTKLLGWSREDLVGTSADGLMWDPTAGGWPVALCGTGRDFLMRTKEGGRFHAFMVVHRLPGASGHPEDCALVAKVRNVRASSHPPAHLHRRGSTTSRSVISAGRRPRRSISLGTLLPRRSTVVFVEVNGLPEANLELLQSVYRCLLAYVVDCCGPHKGLLHWAFGDRVAVSFNGSSVVNASHTTSAVAYMHQLQSLVRSNPLLVALRVFFAAAAGGCACGPFGPHQTLVGPPPALCHGLLRAAQEAQGAPCVVDDPIYQEVNFTYICRQLNVLLLHPGTSDETRMSVWEVMGPKDCNDEEWMYQLLHTAQAESSLSHWRECWLVLRRLDGADPPAAAGALAEAEGHLRAHLEGHPTDQVAMWLREALRPHRAQPTEPAVEAIGVLRFALRYAVGRPAVALNHRLPSSASLGSPGPDAGPAFARGPAVAALAGPEH